MDTDLVDLSVFFSQSRQRTVFPEHGLYPDLWQKVLVGIVRVAAFRKSSRASLCSLVVRVPVRNIYRFRGLGIELKNNQSLSLFVAYVDSLTASRTRHLKGESWIMCSAEMADCFHEGL